MKLVSTGCGFVFAVMAAQLLGADGYGVVAFASSVLNIAAIVSLFGTNGLAVREAAALSTRGEWGHLRRFVRWASLTVLGTSVVAVLIVATGAFFGGPYGHALLVAALAVPMLAALYLFRGTTQGLGRVVEAQVPMDIVRWVLMLPLIGSLFLFAKAASASDVLWMIVASYAISLVVAGAILRRHMETVAPEKEPPQVEHRWFAQSLPFLTVALFGIVGTEINTLLLGSLSGPRDAGLYQPIARLAPIMILAREAIEMPLAPRIVAMWEHGDRAALQRLMRSSALAYLFATAVTAAVILAMSPYIFGAFGPEFGAYRFYLYWIAFAQVAGAAAGAAPLLLAMIGSMKRRVQAQAITLAVQAGSGLLLVPILGVLGAVISLTASILIWCVLHWLFAWRETGIDTSAVSAIRARFGSPA